MPPRHVILLLAFTISSFAASPNVLLIVGDDIGHGDLSCYGNKEVATPNLDAIAAGGTWFTSGYVMAPVCGPSRAALLTGRYPGHVLPYVGNLPHGSSIGLPKEHRLLSDHLHDAGYRTAALGKWHLGEQAGFEPQARGFDSFYGFLGGMHDYFQVEDEQWLWMTSKKKCPVTWINGHRGLENRLGLEFSDYLSVISCAESAKSQHVDVFAQE